MEDNIGLEQVDYNPFSDNEIVKAGKVTNAQREIWLSCILGGDDANLSYNESASLRFSGDLKESLLWEACDRLVERHEALRMTFSGDGNHYLLFKNLEPYKINRDFSVFSEEEKDREIKGVLDGEALFVFDLMNGPLIRFSLIKLSEASFLFTITAHHLIADGWSFGVMFEEIADHYNALKDNNALELSTITQFSEYALEMEEFENSAHYHEVEQYWLKKYSQVPDSLDLPLDGIRPKQRTFKSRRDDFLLSSDLTVKVKELGRKSKSSLVSTIMAAFEIFLHKITGQDDIVLGLPTAGQAATGHLVLVGHCVNLLPIRTKITSNLSFQDYLERRRGELLDDYDHQKFTFGNLIEKLDLKRDPSRIPLVPVVFNIDMGMDDQVNFSGLEHRLISNPRKFENFEIFLNLTRQGSDLIVEWSYNTDLFQAETIKNWMIGIENLLAQVVAEPQKSIKHLVFNENLIFQKLQEWNDTAMEIPVDDSFLQLFWEQAKLRPSQLAYVAGGKEFSFEELRKYCNSIATELFEKGIGKGDVVGVMLDRNEKLLPTLLGVLESGSCYVPLDPGFPEERIAYMLEDSKAKLLVTENHYQTKFQDKIQQFVLEDLETLDISKSRNFESPRPESLAYILYTSGSTGKPKGVKVTHLNLLNFLVSMRQNPGMKAGEKLLAITTVSFDIAGLELYLPLIAGGTVILADNEECKDGRLLLKKMASHQIDFMQATPATWRMLIVSGWNKPMNFKLLCGGEALPSDLAAKLLHLVGPFWNVYGPTETTIWSTVKMIQDAADITIGKPISNTQVYILNKDLNPCPSGVVGEICIGGIGVAKGYHHRDELTAEKFISDPFSKGQGSQIYRTGDLGKFLPNGELLCLGRMDFQVKVRGYRIELEEIEAKLNQIAGIEQAAVSTWEPNPGDVRLVAYVVRGKKPNEQSEDHLIMQCKERLKDTLPEYMVPTEWVLMDKLPLTNNNKVDRKALPKPNKNAGNSQIELSQPVTEEQKTVQKIWQKLLGAGNIGLESDFFELGGHSLLAVELMVAIENQTGQKLPVNSVFQYPTLKNFSNLLEPEMKSEISWQSLVPIQPKGKKTPLFLIHGAGANITPFYGLANHLDPEQPVYGIQSKGLNGIDEPLHTIEEMAAFYIEEIKKVCPQGPFHLGGQSFGAYVAFEMAKQLKSKGQSVGKIILFDVSAYQSETKLTPLDKVKMKVWYQIEKRIIDTKLAFTHPDTLKRSKLRSFNRKKKLFNHWFGKDENTTGPNMFENLERIRKINHKAMDEYLLSHYDGEIILLKAKIRTFLVGDKEFYGWKPYASQVITMEMEGDHNSMFDDPALVINFADTLQKLMDG